jgi:hypothetical protein
MSAVKLPAQGLSSQGCSATRLKYPALVARSGSMVGPRSLRTRTGSKCGRRAVLEQDPSSRNGPDDVCRQMRQRTDGLQQLWHVRQLLCERQTCNAGTCQCPVGTTLCNGNCVNTMTDGSNCAACGVACAGVGELCCNSTCVVAICIGGSTFNRTTCQCECPSSTTMCNGTCVNETCPTGQTFNTAACQCECLGGGTLCNGACTNTQTDSSNCGARGTVCSGTTPTCFGGHRECATVCLGNLVLDPSTCTCVPSCPTGTTACNGTCTNTQVDSSNCGMCGTARSGGQTCNGGSCACPTGTTLCNGACVNTSTDSNNCGRCGNPCVGGQPCCSGACCSCGDDPTTLQPLLCTCDPVCGCLPFGFRAARSIAPRLVASSAVADQAALLRGAPVVAVFRRATRIRRAARLSQAPPAAAVPTLTTAGSADCKGGTNRPA